jgi:hypothetical protein
LGGRFGEFSLFAQNNHLTYAYNWVGIERFVVTSTETLPTGAAQLRLEFTADGPGRGAAALFKRQARRRGKDRAPGADNIRT